MHFAPLHYWSDADFLLVLLGVAARAAVVGGVVVWWVRVGRAARGK